MTLMAYPYGNAKETKNADGTWSFTCQHGVGECIGNMYEACGIEHFPNVSSSGVPQWWNYFYCLEKSGNAGSASVATACANNNGLVWSTIDTCASSDPQKGSTADGNPLMHNIAVDTNNLQPPHQWTPWVVVDGSPLNEAQLDLPLIPIVCKAALANPQCTKPPTACTSVSSRIEKP